MPKKKTSKSVAKVASTVLRDKRQDKTSKTTDGSALAQREKSKRRK